MIKLKTVCPDCGKNLKADIDVKLVYSGRILKREFKIILKKI